MAQRESYAQASEYLPSRFDAVQNLKIVVAQRCGLTLKELHESSHRRRNSFARQEVMWLARALLHKTYNQIGRQLGRDHTTIIFGARAFAKRHGLPPPEAAPWDLAWTVLCEGPGGQPC